MPVEVLATWRYMASDSGSNPPVLKNQKNTPEYENS